MASSHHRFRFESNDDYAKDLKEKVFELGTKIKMNLEDELDDAGDQLSQLKGFLSEILGDLPFKCAIVFIIFFNFSYTFYDAFFAARLSGIIESDCYCDPTDRAFYRIVTLVSMSLWVSFLIVYGAKSTCKYGHLIRHKSAKQCKHHEIEQIFSELLESVKKHEKQFQSQLCELVTSKFLDNDYCNLIEHYYTNLYEKKATKSTDGNAVVTNANPPVNNKQPKRYYCFMAIKVSLIAFRFTFRLFVVPILQLQWFNDYAWNCLMNKIIRDYCETENTKYYIGLDHSILLYSVYIVLLVALLFSVLITWFPKGIPHIVLLKNARKMKVIVRRRVDKGAPYTLLENDDDEVDEETTPNDNSKNTDAMIEENNDASGHQVTEHEITVEVYPN